MELSCSCEESNVNIFTKYTKISLLLKNHIIIFTGLYLRKHNPNTSTLNQVVDFLIFCQVGSIAVLLILVTILFIALPRFPVLFSNVMPVDMPFIFQIIIHMYHLYVSLVSILANLIPLSWTLIYGIFVGTFIAKELCLGRSRYKSSSYLRDFVTLAIEYRAFQLLGNRFNCLIGPYLVPTEIIIEIVFWCTGSAAVKHRNDMKTAPFILYSFWCIVIPLLYSIVLLLGGHLHYNVNKVLNSWKCRQNFKTARERKLLRKFRLSCQPIFISHGKMYTIKKVNLLLFSRALAKGLMKALLMLN